MAVTVTDRRTVQNEADAVTGWTGSGPTLDTTQFAEATGSIGDQINIATNQLYHTGTSRNLGTSPGTLVYVYTWNSAFRLGWTTGAHTLMLGDGTDRIGFHMSGNDKEAFSHSDGPVVWQNFVLDTGQASTMNSAGETSVYAGSFAGLNFAAITQFGAGFITQSKALGGGYNCFCDIIRFGNDGIRVTAGGSGTEGTFLEIVTEDRSTATLKAHGVIRELTTGVYGIQSPITFGDSGAATTSYFLDSGIVLAYENRNIGNDKYYLNIEGNAGATNFFELTNSTITTAGPLVTCDFASGNIDTLTFDAVTFTQLGNSITFSNAADATGHNITNCAFNSCGQIDPGDVTFSGNTISSTTAGATGALLLDADGASNWSDIEIIAGADATSHGIYIPPAADGTYDFAGIVGTNFDSTNGGPKAMIYNNSGGAVVINADAASANLSYLNGASATTTINNTVTVTVTVKDAVTLANIQNARVYLTIDAGATVIFNSLTNASGVVTTSYSYTADKAIAGVVRKGSASPLYKEGTLAGTITSSGLDITVLLVGDE